MTTACQGTTSADETALMLQPLESLSQSVQSCDAGATSAHAGAIRQSQLYPTGFCGWGVAHAEGQGPGGIEADAASVVDLTFLEPARPGDLNGDCVVNGFDLVLAITWWGDRPDQGICDAHANADGAIDASDIVFVILRWDP